MNETLKFIARFSLCGLLLTSAASYGSSGFEESSPFKWTIAKTIEGKTTKYDSLVILNSLLKTGVEFKRDKVRCRQRKESCPS